jgi:hypothetical protein
MADSRQTPPYHLQRLLDTAIKFNVGPRVRVPGLGLAANYIKAWRGSRAAAADIFFIRRI